jgi:DNA processing protein
MRDENTLYWLWLAEKCGAASKQFGKLIERYDDPFDIYRLGEDEVEQLDGVNGALKAKLCEKDLETSYSILKYCKENRVDVIAYGDARYPARLKNIEDAPILLYCLGHFPDFNSALCVGIVGTRKMSEYGKQSAYKIGYELASAGAIVVSGMALGVDGAAASGALSAGGRTVAVLGCGISVVYPKEHKKLMEEISRRGAVITEYPPTEAPHGHNFPKRNRIISGLCQGVLVVEGAVGSGALITARRAIDQGREVFALPGKIDESNSEGPNELIRAGAYPVLSSDDILRHYDFLYHDVIDYSKLTKAKRKVSKGDADAALKKYGVGVKVMRFAKDAENAPKMPEKAVIDEESFSLEESPTVNKSDSTKAEAAPERKESMADNSAEILATLDETTRRVFESLPIDKAVSPDALAAVGIGVGDTITSLTMLELCGLVNSLPGGLYVRK